MRIQKRESGQHLLYKILVTYNINSNSTQHILIWVLNILESNKIILPYDLIPMIEKSSNHNINNVFIIQNKLMGSSNIFHCNITFNILLDNKNETIIGGNCGDDKMIGNILGLNIINVDKYTAIDTHLKTNYNKFCNKLTRNRKTDDNKFE